MKNITINFSDGEIRYNKKFLKNTLEYSDEEKDFREKLDVENLVSKCDERIQNLNSPSISEEQFYRVIQYELANQGYLDDAGLYQILADTAKEFESKGR